MIDKSVSAAIGEYFVLGELLRRNIEAYLAHGKNQKGWDISVFKQQKTIRIQVKTISWPLIQAVNGKFSGFDFLVVVLLNTLDKKSRFYIFCQNELDAISSKLNEARQNGGRTLTFSKQFMEKNKISEDAWSKISK